MDEKLRVIKPCGYLHTVGNEYYLLKPEPIVGDSWEGDNCYRFLAVPVSDVSIEQKGKDIYPVFGYARHVITNSFSIEICDLDEIHIQAEVETYINENPIMEDEDDKEDNYPF